MLAVADGDAAVLLSSSLTIGIYIVLAVAVLFTLVQHLWHCRSGSKVLVEASQQWRMALRGRGRDSAFARIDGMSFGLPSRRLRSRR